MLRDEIQRDIFFDQDKIEYFHKKRLAERSCHKRYDLREGVEKNVREERSV